METTPKHWRRGFWSLIATQFQGAFSDCTLKNLVIFIILGMGLPEGQRDKLVPIVGALFALPFILFSMAGGYFADHYSKRAVTIGIKVFEIAVMLIATVGLMLKNLPMELTGVFLMGVHSAIFGPSKYGLLPEILPDTKLSWGNGIIEFGTFAAIILGTALGAILSDMFRGRQVFSGAILIVLAVVGLAMSFGISRVPAAAPHKPFQINFLSDLWTQIKLMHKDRPLWMAMLGNTYFSFFGTILQFNIILYGKDVLKLADTQNGYLQASAAIGIGVGSVAAGYLSRGKIETRLIPLGSIGMTLFAVVLGLPNLSSWMFAAGLIVVGLFGGFFVVPIGALLQHRPKKDEKGGILAAANLLSFVGVFVASGFYYLLISVLKLSPGAVFVCCGVMTLLGTIYIVRLLPESFLGLFRKTAPVSPAGH
ncbi:MAG: AMP-dependent synthetase and ligase [Verrucomicrobiales bacterium]|nr:AMP-dependent synthetase and ligase [Verrucomicrobiales bacterium]